MVQLGCMFFITECTVKKVDQKVRNLNQHPSYFTIFQFHLVIGLTHPSKEPYITFNVRTRSPTTV